MLELPDLVPVARDIDVLPVDRTADERLDEEERLVEPDDRRLDEPDEDERPDDDEREGERLDDDIDFFIFYSYNSKIFINQYTMLNVYQTFLTSFIFSNVLTCFHRNLNL